MEDELATLVDDRCKVALGAILRFKDTEIDPIVPAEVSAGLRRTVLREVNGFKDFLLEVLGSVHDRGMAVNQIWLEEIGAKLDDVHRAVTNGSS